MYFFIKYILKYDKIIMKGSGGMRNRVGGIYIENSKILLIHRNKIVDGEVKDYYCIPGGGVEDNEDNISTLIREMKEELGIDLIDYEKEPSYTYQSDKGMEYYYKIYKFDGVIGTGEGPEFTSPSYKDHGSYELEFVKIKDLIDGKINLLPPFMKEKLISDLKQGLL